MTVCGIVAEYNPFHNGHMYHANQSRKAGATHVVAVMSGCFVQRAEPAIISKFRRAEIAARCGADLVIELPVQYAIGSSERFAEGAVSILASLGCVDMLSFGSECADITALAQAAEAITDPRVVGLTRRKYEQGNNYPTARHAAAAEVYGRETAAILGTPNNLLAVDYIKALQSLGSKIEPYTIPRKSVAHDAVVVMDEFASASFLRREIAAGRDVSQFVPPPAAEVLSASKLTGSIGGGLKAIEPAVLLKLRAMKREQFEALPDCADGLGNRLYNAAAVSKSIDELYNTAKTKRYTMSRVRRAAACALLDIDTSYYFPPPYARILAIGPLGEQLLGAISKTTAIPVSHSIKKLIALDGNAEKTACAEIRATDIFNLTLRDILPTAQDYTEKLYIEQRPL